MSTNTGPTPTFVEISKNLASNPHYFEKIQKAGSIMDGLAFEEQVAVKELVLHEGFIEQLLEDFTSSATPDLWYPKVN